MRAMIAPGEPCLQRFRSSMPGTYVSRASATRSRDGVLTLEFRAGERADFSQCIVDAIGAARIPVELAGPVEVPLVFDFTATGH